MLRQQPAVFPSPLPFSAPPHSQRQAEASLLPAAKVYMPAGHAVQGALPFEYHPMGHVEQPVPSKA